MGQGDCGRGVDAEAIARACLLHSLPTPFLSPVLCQLKNWSMETLGSYAEVTEFKSPSSKGKGETKEKIGIDALAE